MRRDVAGDAWEAGEQLIDEAGDAIQEGIDALEEAAEELEDLAEDATDAIEDAADWLADEAGDLWTDLVAETGDIFAALEEFAEEQWQDAGHFVDGIVDTVTDAIEEAWEHVARSVEQAWEGLAAAAESAWHAATDAIERAWEEAAAGVERAWRIIEAAALGVAHVAVKLYESALDLAESLAQFVWDIIQGIGQFLVALGACLGGEIIYQIAKADNIIANQLRPYLQIPPSVRTRLAGVFPGKDFANVFFVDQALLAANHFKSGTEGMTFGMLYSTLGIPGNALYLKPKFDFSQANFKRLLVHELVHVLQYRQFGHELAFACAYGIGYVKAGFDYKKNPLEAQAYDFVTRNQTVIDAL